MTYIHDGYAVRPSEAARFNLLTAYFEDKVQLGAISGVEVGLVRVKQRFPHSPSSERGKRQVIGFHVISATLNTYHNLLVTGIAHTYYRANMYPTRIRVPPQYNPKTKTYTISFHSSMWNADIKAEDIPSLEKYLRRNHKGEWTK